MREIEFTWLQWPTNIEENRKSQSESREKSRETHYVFFNLQFKSKSWKFFIELFIWLLEQWWCLNELLTSHMI